MDAHGRVIKVREWEETENRQEINPPPRATCRRRQIARRTRWVRVTPNLCSPDYLLTPIRDEEETKTFYYDPVRSG